MNEINPETLEKSRKVIYVCAPLKGDIAANIESARGHCKKIIEAGHYPFSLHLALDRVLDDTDPEQRKKALQMGLRMLEFCNEVWVFGDAVSEGMKKEIEAASRAGIPVVF